MFNDVEKNLFVKITERFLQCMGFMALSQFQHQSLWPLRSCSGLQAVTAKEIVATGGVAATRMM